jgi:hypothetical protein
MVASFGDRLGQLAAANACLCPACVEMHHLRLRVIAHVDCTQRLRVGPCEELAGTGVIAVHRLLKSRIDADSYLLVTAAAYAAMAPGGIWLKSVEDLDLLGRWPVFWQPIDHHVSAPPCHPIGIRDGIRKLVYRLRHLVSSRPACPSVSAHQSRSPARLIPESMAAENSGCRKLDEARRGSGGA